MTGRQNGATDQPRMPVLPLVAVCLGFFMVMLDTTIVNIALPAIGRSLNGGVDLLQWVVDSYTLVFAALLLSAGALGDRIGPRRVFLAGLGAFALFSAVCAVAPTGGWLVAARALQGVGAAALVPGSLALINASYPDRASRAKAIGIWGGMGGIAAACGPVLGGALIDGFGWQAVFLVNVPVAAIAYLLVVRYVINPRPEHRRSLDLPGQGLAITALASLTYALIDGGGSSGWQTRDTVLIVGGLLLIMGFLVLEARRRDPMLPVGLFRDPGFSTANVTGLLLNFGFYGQYFVLTLYLQQLRHYPPLTAGLLIAPEALGAVVGSPLGGRTTARFGPRMVMITGLVLGAIAFLAMLPVGAHTNYALLGPVIFVAGFGISFAMPAATAAALQAAPPERAGVAAGVVNAARQTGSVLGVAVLGTLTTTSGSFLTGFHAALTGSAVIFAVGAVLNIIQLRSRHQKADQPSPASEQSRTTENAATHRS